MRSLLLFLLLFAVTLWAGSGERSADTVYLQAETIQGDERGVSATGDVILEYRQAQLRAAHARYDKVDKKLTLEGSVKIINPDGSSVETERIVLYVPQEKVRFEHFLYRGEEHMWLWASEASRERECYALKEASFSTCLFSDPDWHLGFAEADYNATSKYMKLKDIKFYVGQTPIFYFPYLAFSTARERSSGLLIPHFGYNSKEGLIYEQPIFWAISPSMDMTFNPQIRTDRSLGIYSTFRFADSAVSEGLVRVGYFADDADYAQRYNLENSEHYGLEARYESQDVLGEKRPEGYTDALYANLVLFNDIDYLNLQKEKLSHLSDSHLKESRVNYLLYNESYYMGLGAKYFLDASLDSNAKTLQELPSLRWHRFDTVLGASPLSYSMDAKLSHYTRTEGTTSRQLEFSVPVAYRTQWLDGYLQMEVSEELYGFWGEFDLDAGGEDENYHTLMATHRLKLSSDLVKPYLGGIHTVEWSLAYEKQEYLGDGLAEYEALEASLRRDFLSREPFDDRVVLGWNQYWYSTEMTLEAKQRISQIYYPDREEQWGVLRHELELDYGRWQASNLFEYSFAYDNFSEMSNKLRYRGDSLDLELEHFWRKDLEAELILTNELAFDLRYRYSDSLKLFGSMTYDLEEEQSKKWRAGFLYDRGCWSMELSYNHDTTSILAKDGADTIDNNTFLVRVNLVPFGGSEFRQ